MFRNDLYKLKDGRVCYSFPWDSKKLPCPWRAGYMRVMIPLNPVERRGSTKKCHIQVVRTSKVERVQEVRLRV